MTADHPLDALVEEMLPAATELAVCVRDRDAEAVHAVLGPVLAAGDRARTAALMIALAVMIPDDASFGDLIAWTHQDQLPYGQLVVGPGEKWCGGCAQVLPVGAFQQDTSRPDGLKYRCRLCFNEQERKRYRRGRQSEASTQASGLSADNTKGAA